MNKRDVIVIILTLLFSICLWMHKIYENLNFLAKAAEREGYKDKWIILQEEEWKKRTQDLQDLYKKSQQEQREDTCKKRMERELKYIREANLEKLKNCDMTYPLFVSDDNYYLVQKKDNDKCNIEKREVSKETGRPPKKKWSCHVPMPEYSKAYELIIEYSKKMCDSDFDKIKSEEQIEEILSKYCK